MRFSLAAFLKNYLPTGLFPRSLLIIVMPVVVTQIVVAFVFMERHWNTVTQRLSRAAVSDIAMLVDLRMREQGSDSELLSQMAGDTFSMSVAFLPGESLPETETAPTVALLRHQAMRHRQYSCLSGLNRCGVCHASHAELPECTCVSDLLSRVYINLAARSTTNPQPTTPYYG